MSFEARTRWSQLARGCVRMSAYALQGTEPEEPSDLLKGYFARGKDCENHIYARFEAKYGQDDLIRHKAVPWPAGIAHGDIFVRSLGLPIEVKSMGDPRPLDGHIVQLAGQIIFDNDAHGEGLLVLVNPLNYQTREVPVIVTPELEQRVQGLVDGLLAAAKPKADLPARVCKRPSEALGMGCPFSDTCFASWEQPDPIILEGDVAKLAGQIMELDKQLSEAKTTADELEEQRNGLRELLRHVIEPAKTYLSDDGNVEVKITEVAARTTFSVKDARATGVFTKEDEERFAPFIKVGKPSARWTVRAPFLDIHDKPLELASLADFGNEAPWTDSDLEAFGG